MLVRLNKFLAHAGVCSRREADRFILEGRVQVNGLVVDELGSQVDPAHDKVQVNGRTARQEEEGPAFLLLYKPRGHVVTVKDPFGRPTVMDLLPKLRTRVYPVGRLDAASEGALLFTNEGDLAHRLTHPRYGVKKVYEVNVAGEPAPADLEKLRRGIFLEGKKTASAVVQVLRRGPTQTILRLEIHEGRKREIRKMFEALGFEVRALTRVAFAGLRLEGLKPGQWRPLKKNEIENLRKLVS